ncbi:SMP-30/gluconolactonase/LRE family protein [Nocardia sp. CA-107356]|uniref:SMP-30/gluconolactonase/LRE family protein n=1 Tax=Nocardia sp. CA-107356 TaxID=3239972 RepID=UPI003D8BD0BF
MGSVELFPTPDVVIRAQATVGEGPVWDRRTGRLCWVDINNGLLFENDLATGGQSTSALGTLLGAAAPRAQDEGFAVAVSEGLGIFADGKLQILDPVLPEPTRRMNDAKCDSRGRLWAGSTHLDFVPGVGAVHRWDGQAPSSIVATGFALPNGLGWNAEDNTMYLADSMANLLFSAPYRSDEGEVGAFTPLCEIRGGLPDGLAVDLDGCLWVAIWGGSEVRRYAPTGELIGRIPMPVEQPSSCAFADDGTLYITSASADISEDGLSKQPLAGSVFALATNTAGVPVQPFAA